MKKRKTLRTSPKKSHVFIILINRIYIVIINKMNKYVEEIKDNLCFFI